ncbi:hypothetical protein [Hyphomicrobium sp.]|uniref:hypothetical protein n=1 Tax=Hyphomicrobium sp. TaxID=82 RepID=UPI0025C14A77|nr:hypothetical protein [Hyphomicrobium sp.]MCC7253360.1 hypothetical protein [Hyphomicrobium sp.]
MTDDADIDRAAREGGLLRLITLVAGSVEIIAFTLLAHLLLQSADPLGEDVGVGKASLMALPLVGLILPGLLLAWLDRAPRIALALVLLAIPVATVSCL